ncbi:MAG: ABC transporter substrate-binding protein, partial [Chloroflexi bacterium]|nr:ABC transporter substrate-binding protein [Chloroflexota bacterium]
YNEQGIIPGVNIKLVSYDMRTDFSRNLPGYYWVTQQGAKVVISVLAETTETVKTFAQNDRIPLVGLATSTSLVEPPGWVFCLNCPSNYEIMTLLKWISDNHWDYTRGIPKIGMAAWAASIQIEVEKAAREYCQAHPDKFQWVGGYLTPLGTMTWGSEVDRLKGCDYIIGGNLGPENSTFMKEFLAKGFTTTFIATSSLSSARGFIVDALGWKDIDGTLSLGTCPYWNEQSSVVDLAKQLLNTYRPADSESIIRAGSGYEGGFHNAYEVLEILQKAVEAVGAESFDGQAFYDAAVKYKVSWQGYPGWGLTETKRYLVDQILVFKWSAQAADLVRVGDWVPVVTG